MRKLELGRASTNDILNASIWELDISFHKSAYASCLEKLQQELTSKKLLVRPRIYLSDEWFCPDHISSIAIPFTLSHPKLISLERNYLGSVEGESFDHFMKLLRHECGHVMDNAYFLREEVSRIEVFGDHSLRYPSSYIPKVFSRNYVYHLEEHYAQAHPEEDFAETFATWLTPNSHWRKVYEGWPALSKLKYVDSVMRGLRHQQPNVICYKEVDSFEESSLTVREYLKLKRKRLKKQLIGRRSLKHIENYLQDQRTTGIPLKEVLKGSRRQLVRDIALKTNEYQYKIESVVKDLELISNDRNLIIPSNFSPDVIQKILLSHTERFFKEGRDRIIM